MTEKPLLTSSQLHHRQKLGAKFTLAGAGVGVVALGLRGASGSLRTAERAATPLHLLRPLQKIKNPGATAMKFERASNTVGTGAVGISSASALNSARLSNDAARRHVVKAYAPKVGGYTGIDFGAGFGNADGDSDRFMEGGNGWITDEEEVKKDFGRKSSYKLTDRSKDSKADPDDRFKKLKMKKDSDTKNPFKDRKNGVHKAFDSDASRNRRSNAAPYAGAAVAGGAGVGALHHGKEALKFAKAPGKTRIMVNHASGGKALGLGLAAVGAGVGASRIAQYNNSKKSGSYRPLYRKP